MPDDTLANSILRLVGDLGYVVTVHPPKTDDQPLRVEALGPGGERFIVEHDDLYRASCELAVLVGIDLEE